MYCKNCGTRIGDNRFCTICGVEQQEKVVLPQSPGRTPSRLSQSNATSTTVKPTRRKRSVMAILVAIVVIFAGLQFILLNIVGKTSIASVTSSRQDRKSYGESSPNPNRYRIQYTFSLKGKNYVGSSSMIFKQGIRSDMKINVLYLPYYPGINSPAEDTKITSGLLLTGFGTFLLVMGIQGKGRIQLRM